MQTRRASASLLDHPVVLANLRKYSSSRGVKVLYALLAVSFIGWGVGAPTLGEGYVRITETAHPAVAGLASSMHFFNGIAEYVQKNPTKAEALLAPAKK